MDKVNPFVGGSWRDNRSGKIVWEYSQGLLTAAFASTLPEGNTLITDAGHNRIIEVTPTMQIIFQYFTNTSANSNAYLSCLQTPSDWPAATP